MTDNYVYNKFSDQLYYEFSNMAYGMFAEPFIHQYIKMVNSNILHDVIINVKIVIVFLFMIIIVIINCHLKIGQLIK